MHAARAVAAAADRHRVGVALHEADIFERHAEPFRHHLRVDGGMALAVRMGAGEDREHAARIEAQHHAVVEHRGLLEEVADAAAAQLAVLFRFGGALLEAVPVGELQAFVHDVDEVAAVVGDAGLQLMRHRGGWNEIAPPDLDRIDADDFGGAIEQLLDQISGFRPAGAAIRRHRNGVGEHRLADAVHSRNLINAGRQPHREQRHHHGRGKDVRAHGVQRIDAQAENLALLVDREFAGDDLIAALRVAKQRLRARPNPFHRPAADPARCPHHQRIFRVAAVFHAEAAADVGRNYAQLGFGNSEHVAGHRGAGAMRILRGRVQRVIVAIGMILADRGARLDRIGA